MAWSSAGYSYTKEEIGQTAYNAGCGNGWYWIHKRPNMFISGNINDDGTYNLTFYKAITSQFNYTLRFELNGKTIFNYNNTILNYKTRKDSTSGSGLGTHATLKMFCGDKNCDVHAGGTNGSVIIDVDLYKAPSNLSLTIVSKTGTTISVKPTWNNGSRANSAVIECNNELKEANNSGDIIKFTGLKNNTNYSIICTSSDGITNLDVPVMSVLTYGVIAEVKSTTTCSAVFHAKYNQDGGKDKYIQYKYNGLTSKVLDNNDVTLTKLVRNSEYITVTCSLLGIDDAITVLKISLKELILKNTGITTNQFHITTTWQAYAGSKKYDTNITFKTYSCYINDKNHTKVGNTAGDYSKNKTLTSYNLYSYTDYVITCTVSDGYNESKPVTIKAKTLFPYMRIYHNGKWYKAIPLIYNPDKKWHISKAMNYNGSSWRENNSK